MTLFFLMAENADGGGPFLRDVTSLVSQDKLEVFRDLPSFIERLRRPRDASSTVLIVGPSHEDLRKVVSLREFLKDAKILLVLEDQGEETIALAHQVLPTYITYTDNGTSGLISVLKQLMRDVPASRSAM